MQHALIVEDIATAGQWLEGILQAAFNDIHTTQCSSCRQTREFMQTTCVNLALLDINLPKGSSIAPLSTA
ncbi:MAG: hypothetical protein JG718_17670 [Candidatus Thiothrix moscowensis]|nr:hypothetical protein [Candidatus Thiothrix moscowensis]